MARMIENYVLKLSTHKQSISMPRRARILHVAPATRGEGEVILSAEVVRDMDTKQLDGKFQRHFLLIDTGAIPEGAGWVGACHMLPRLKGQDTSVIHVFEVQR